MPAPATRAGLRVRIQPQPQPTRPLPGGRRKERGAVRVIETGSSSSAEFERQGSVGGHRIAERPNLRNRRSGRAPGIPIRPSLDGRRWDRRHNLDVKPVDHDARSARAWSLRSRRESHRRFGFPRHQPQIAARAVGLNRTRAWRRIGVGGAGDHGSIPPASHVARPRRRRRDGAGFAQRRSGFPLLSGCFSGHWIGGSRLVGHRSPGRRIRPTAGLLAAWRAWGRDAHGRGRMERIARRR